MRRRRLAWFRLSAATVLVLVLCLGAAPAAPACPPPPVQPSVAQMQAAQRDARDLGLLWRLSKDGHDSWLFGTIHVGTLAWSTPGPRLREALMRSDVLALEIDPMDPGLAAQLQQATRNAPPAEPDLRRRLQAQAEAACLGADALAGVHPLLQLMTLTLLQARHEGLDAAFAQELMLAAAARAAGLSLVALESVEQQVGALLPSDPAQMQQLLQQGLEQLERAVAAGVLRRLTAAWADGDLDTLQRYAQWCECAEDEAQRAWLHRLLDERNAQLAAGIDALHAQGRKVLAAVGALHMTGTQALPELLQQRGYQVQRVAF
jgi:uncharacterized protein YbaP (TraB family)